MSMPDADACMRGDAYRRWVGRVLPAGERTGRTSGGLSGHLFMPCPRHALTALEGTPSGHISLATPSGEKPPWRLLPGLRLGDACGGGALGGVRWRTRPGMWVFAQLAAGMSGKGQVVKHTHEDS